MIYPYQEQAIISSILNLLMNWGYEKYALPVLAAIGRNDEYFISANRLVKF